jgi:hypothetical protein
MCRLKIGRVDTRTRPFHLRLEIMASPRPMSVDASDDGPLDSASSRRERARVVLLPPITNLCTALGGFEEIEDALGNVTRVYQVGDECLGERIPTWQICRMTDAIRTQGASGI